MHYKFNNMHFRILMLLSDFMKALNRRRKHYTKNENFPMHLLFTIIYLLQEQKLNHNYYHEQENKYDLFYTS
jgi:hypothetical protein